MQYVKRKSPPKVGNYVFQTLSLFLNYLEQYQVHLPPQGRKKKTTQNQPTYILHSYRVHHLPGMGKYYPK